MIDKNTFMETLRAVQEVAKTSDQPMDRETALTYFKEMELSPEQEEMVYQFLMLPQPEREPETEVQEDEQSGQATAGEVHDSEKTKEGVAKNSTTHFQMYLDELEEITELEAEEEEQLYQKLLAGDTSVMEELTTKWLKRVIILAQEYQDRGSLLDDLVQEGNIGLLMGLNALAAGQEADIAGQQVLIEVRRQLEESVRTAMEEYLGEENGEEQQNETILGKVSLVHQAREFLTKEKGETPSLRELSEYTRIPAEEISDILSLIKEKQL